MISFDLCYDSVKNEVLIVKIGARILDMARYTFWDQCVVSRPQALRSYNFM